VGKGGGADEHGSGWSQVVGSGAAPNAAKAGRAVEVRTKWEQVLEQGLFESQGRGLVIVQHGRVIERGCVIDGESAQRAFPKIKRGTTSPVGEPVLSSGRKASGSATAGPKGGAER
jgi:hypothetical protein